MRACDPSSSTYYPALEHGFRVGVYNKRGMTTRDPHAGDAPERALAAQYREWGGRLAAASPRTSAALLHIGDRYEAEAHREDVRGVILRMIAPPTRGPDRRQALAFLRSYGNAPYAAGRRKPPLFSHRR